MFTTRGNPLTLFLNELGINISLSSLFNLVNNFVQNIYLFIYKESKRERERERKKNPVKYPMYFKNIMLNVVYTVRINIKHLDGDRYMKHSFIIRNFSKYIFFFNIRRILDLPVYVLYLIMKVKIKKYVFRVNTFS